MSTAEHRQYIKRKYTRRLVESRKLRGLRFYEFEWVSSTERKKWPSESVPKIKASKTNTLTRNRCGTTVAECTSDDGCTVVECKGAMDVGLQLSRGTQWKRAIPVTEIRYAT